MYIFNPTVRPPPCPGRFIWQYVVDWLQANAKIDEAAVMKSCMISWKLPDIDWVKLNIDGSMIRRRGSISAGGVVRDQKKNWLIGFALNKGSGSVQEAELWGILEGLNLVWKKGLSDSQSAVALLINNISMCHPSFSIIQACKVLMNKDWSCNI
ncbi:hypothetical protein Ddye_005190 [Dipteronia dyeriana]|uniref:RNase H type-1 domain-containing protein n=1 Tax=Dipteronia dyeriana TaxID=168575 RepID=A0AAD9XG19_9ROSI|nr:hypothetical protein Ddye_005190 [Dipteronia dyeriana]